MIASPAVSNAQDVGENEAADGSFLEQIFITARKRVETILDAPVSITAVTAEQLNRQGLNDLQDIAQQVPSVGFDTAVSPIDFRPSIRGIQADRGRNNVGLLIDDVDITSENVVSPGGGSLARLRLIDVERVEVVKGPQAALFGRSAFTGAINFITRRPDFDEMKVRAQVDANSLSAFEGKFSVSSPVAENLALGVTGFAYHERGAFRNTTSDEFIGGSGGFGGSLALNAKVHPTTSIYARVEMSDEEFDPPPSFVIAGSTVVPLDANAQAVTGQETGLLFTGPIPDTPVRYDVDPRTGEDYPGTEVDLFRATVIVDGDYGYIGVKSLTSFVDVDTNFFQDNDFISGRDPATGLTTGAFQFAREENETRQFSQELRLFSTGESRFSWLLGGLYWEEDATVSNRYDAALALGPINDADILAFLDVSDAKGTQLTTRDTNHKSFFAWAEYEVVDNLFISAEARYTDETITYGVVVDPPYTGFSGIVTADGTNPTQIISFGPRSLVATADVSENYINPRFSISYRPNADLNIYASAGRGTKPSGIVATGGTTLDTVFDREVMWSYEIGVKSQLFDRTLALNVAGFYQDYSGQQVGSLSIDDDTGIITGIVENAGKSVIWGLEVEGTWRPTRSFELSGGYVYLNSEFKQFSVASLSANAVAEVPCDVTTGTTPDLCILDYSGNRPSDSPKHALTLNAIYTTPITETWDFTVQQNFRFVSQRFVTQANVATQPAYTRLDMNAGVSNDWVTVLLYVENLMDDDTILDANRYLDFGNNFAPAVIAKRPDPLTVGLRVNVDF